MKTFIWGFCGQIGGAIVAQLRHEGFDVCDWISDQPGSRDIWDFLLGRVRAVPPSAAALDEYQAFYEHYFETYLVMITRRGLDFADMHELANEFALTYHTFARALDEHGIELVLFSNMPHEGPEFILYQLAKLRGLKTLICYQTLFDDKFFIVTKMQDMGRFRTTPELFDDGGIGLEPGYRQVSVNMEGLNLADNEPTAIRANGLAIAGGNLARRLKSLRSPIPALKEHLKSLLFAKSAANLQREYLRNIEESALPDEEVTRLISGSLRYVYVPLHLQPELTTSTLGGSYQDQMFAIEQLSARLPPDWRVLVKENPKQTFFQRKSKFFARLRALTNVHLVRNTFSTYQLLERSRFVATISGTACWEALKGGKQCLVFGQAWYSDLPGCHTFGPGFDFPAFLARVDQPVQFESLKAAFTSLMRRAGPGVVDRDYAVLVKDFDSGVNARKVSGALRAVLQSPATVWD